MFLPNCMHYSEGVLSAFNLCQSNNVFLHKGTGGGGTTRITNAIDTIYIYLLFSNERKTCSYKVKIMIQQTKRNSLTEQANFI